MIEILMTRASGCQLAVAAVLTVLSVSGCDDSNRPDAGDHDGGSVDAAATDGAVLCARDLDCDDGMYCTGRERCLPGAPLADSAGCVAGGDPCSRAQTCVEEGDRCVSDTCDDGGDADGDGDRRIACGGGDCDDTNDQIYSTATEVCDADGVDEDCNPETIRDGSAGSTDGDGDTDGFISSTCFNTRPDGTENRGPDCDDSDVNINPAAAEVCNGVDDSCSGAVDDSGASLCPGGLCVAGACDFDAWDLVFGTPSGDTAASVTYDAAGNIYLAAQIGEGTLDFGGGARTVPRYRRGLAVVSYGADGTYRWDYFNASASVTPVDIAVGADGTRVYVTGYSTGDLGEGGGGSGPFLTILDGAGTLRTIQRYVGGVSDNDLHGVAVDDAGVVVVGSFRATVDLGASGGAADLGLAPVGVVLQLDAEGGYLWHRTFPASADAAVRAVAVGPSGAIAIGGDHGGGLEVGATLSEEGAFVALLDPDGTPRWAHPMTGSGVRRTLGVAIGATGNVYAVGYYSRSITLGAGLRFGSSSGLNGFVVGLSPAGTPLWARSFGSAGGDERVTDVAVNRGGDVSIVGEFSTDTDFGRGVRRPPRDSNSGFLARYSADGVPRRDYRYSSGMMTLTRVKSVAIGPGDATLICGSFSETSDFGSGSRVSVGGGDGFLLRTGS